MRPYTTADFRRGRDELAAQERAAPEQARARCCLHGTQCAPEQARDTGGLREARYDSHGVAAPEPDAELALYRSALSEIYDVLDGPTLALRLSKKTQQTLQHVRDIENQDWRDE